MYAQNYINMDMNAIFMFFKLFNIRSVKFILTNKVYVCTKLHVYGHEFNIYVLQIILFTLP